ncbi:MAG TPA: hypothetical protein PKA62_16120, partial [Thermoanaerobaculia bacterium]|nr:hypothetical protein [Thermoanaerobaculia bacterium]
LTRRGTEALRSAVNFFPAIASEATTLAQEASGKVRWWTFAGLRANAALAERLAELGLSVTSQDNFGITLREGSTAAVSVALEKLRSTAGDPAPASLVAEALDGLKFAECVPKDLVTAMLRARLADPVGVSSVVARPAIADEVPPPLPPHPYSIP